MKKIIIIALICVTLISFASQSYAKSDWEFYFFGINPNDFKGRKALPVIVGGLSSFVIHEAGHLIIGNALGMDARLEDHGGMVVMAHNYDDKSDSEKALFHSGGFIFQAFAGSILTAIPATRHSDFTLGVNAFTFVNSLQYGFTGGIGGNSEYSDINQINEAGYPGPAIAIGTGIYAGYLTYINLDKYKESENGAE